MEENKSTRQEVQNEVDADEQKDHNKNSVFLSIIRDNILIVLAVIIAYTLIVVGITVKVDRKIIANKIKKSFSEAFPVQTDTQRSNLNGKETTLVEKHQKNLKNVKISLNETVAKEDEYELTVIGFDFTKRVDPPSASSFYTYYEPKEEGNQLLDIKLYYKNLTGVSIGADDVGSVKISYADKYEYRSFSTIEKGGDFSFSNITNIDPLTVGKLHYIFELPDEVVNSDGSILAYVAIKGTTYELKIR